MPVKNWSDGDYVYGTDLDFITGSLVMRFASAAARTSALVGDLAPTPGMISFTADDQSWWQYVVVSATGYWVPLPGTVVCSMNQTTAQTVNASTPTVITMTGVVKNLGTWWVTSRFTPKAPGYYTFSGGVGWVGSATAGYRLTYLQKTSPPAAAVPVPGSGTELHSSAAYSILTTLRTTSVYMNGTTDYVELMGSHNGQATLDTVVGTYVGSSFTAVYSGPT